MRVYAILVEDRHCDPEIHIFDRELVAVAKARELAKKYCRHPEDYEERHVDGYLFCADYSCESDRITVQAIAVNDLENK